MKKSDLIVSSVGGFIGGILYAGMAVPHVSLERALLHGCIGSASGVFFIGCIFLIRRLTKRK